MLTTRVLDAAMIESQGWVDAILALDRENMSSILRAAGLEFPEDQRRSRLRDSSTVLIAVLDEGTLAGYVEFCADWKCDERIYLSSIQLREKYRHGRAFAILLVECAKALESRAFAHLRTQVQANNRTAVRLYEKLGFQHSKHMGDSVTIELTGSRDLLDSELLRRLKRSMICKL